MATVKPSAFDSLLERMYQRSGVDTLPAHLEGTCGITVTEGDPAGRGGVPHRSDRPGGAVGGPDVLRRHGPTPPLKPTSPCCAISRRSGFRRSGPSGTGRSPVHQDQAVLVTEFIKEAPKAQRPPYPIVQLGAMDRPVTRLGRTGRCRPAGRSPAPLRRRDDDRRAPGGRRLAGLHRGPGTAGGRRDPGCSSCRRGRRRRRGRTTRGVRSSRSGPEERDLHRRRARYWSTGRPLDAVRGWRP